ncbi:MAG: GntR family transcriptional regulator [Peptococcaceae bacterium]|nr:GntR family transcriptional regulator [Peptococcaceae bacterium]
MSVLTPVDITDLRPIRDIVHEKLRTAILRGHLPSGERLFDTLLAKQLGVSRTPVREALRMLEQEALIVVTPRRGTIVSSLKQEDAVEIYNLRAVLEGLALRLAADNITPHDISALREKLEKMRPLPENLAGYMAVHAEFNSILIRASRSPRIEQLVASFTGQLRNLRGISLTSPSRQVSAWKEHCAIVDAIELGDAELAEFLARRHVENAKAAYLEQWA